MLEAWTWVFGRVVKKHLTVFCLFFCVVQCLKALPHLWELFKASLLKKQWIVRNGYLMFLEVTIPSYLIWGTPTLKHFCRQGGACMYGWVCLLRKKKIMLKKKKHTQLWDVLRALNLVVCVTLMAEHCSPTVPLTQGAGFVCCSNWCSLHRFHWKS